MPPAATEKVDFATDVQPIFAKACVACHGGAKQRSGFRLDQKAAAFKGGELGAAIVPGKSAESPLIQYVLGNELRMPPEGPLLSAREVGVLRRWIDDGAAWPDDGSSVAARETWWSLAPLGSPTVPDAPEARSAIDAFILQKLAAARLTTTVLADRPTLVRRVFFDLIGLPPTPEESAAFVYDPAPDAFERLVDRLLASPRYGERWARHWLDVVHFAETHGHDQDRPRDSAWPYRDYVIAAFNRDTPYTRFVAEQIAADALFPQQPELTPALGFLSAGPWDESTLRDIREDTLDREIGRYLDRDDIVTNVMSTFTSLTAHCSRCHDHKFDPIPQTDYYALQAVFAGTEKAEKLYDPDPRLHMRRASLARWKKALDANDAAVIAEMLTDDLRPAFAAWEREAAAGDQTWVIASAAGIRAEHGTEFVPQTDGSYLATGPKPAVETYTVVVDLADRDVASVRLETLTDASLAHQGPGRQENGNLHLTEFKLAFAAANAKEPTPLKLRNPAADFNQEAWDIAKSIDGNPKTAWGIYPQVGKAHAATWELVEPLKKANGKLTFVLEQHHGGNHTIGRLRLSTSSRSPAAHTAPLSERIVALLKKPAAERSPTEQQEVTLRFLGEYVAREIAALPEQQRVYAGTFQFPPNAGQRPSEKPRTVHVLRRGEITKKLNEATAGALSCVSGLPAKFDLPNAEDEAARRAALANWLTNPRNPLIRRTIVNRLWHYHFGRGIVDSPNDFGKMGGLPSHPELLERLAADFQAGGESLKDLQRRIVTSDAYQRATTHLPQAAAVDGENRLLWRMNRKRLDAEQIRDAALVFSDRLDLAMGGPSVRQFAMSPGIHVTPKVDYQAFDLDAPAGRRRSIYRFLFRTLPDPLLDALDCPAGDQSAPVRGESVTALTALTMLNNRFLVRQCEHIAAAWEVAGDRPTQIRTAFRALLNREPTAEELAAFTAYADQHGLANVCRVLLNGNEFLFVN